MVYLANWFGYASSSPPLCNDFREYEGFKSSFPQCSDREFSVLPNFPSYIKDLPVRRYMLKHFPVFLSNICKHCSPGDEVMIGHLELYAMNGCVLIWDVFWCPRGRTRQLFLLSLAADINSMSLSLSKYAHSWCCGGENVYCQHI